MFCTRVNRSAARIADSRVNRAGRAPQSLRASHAAHGLLRTSCVCVWPLRGRLQAPWRAQSTSSRRMFARLVVRSVARSAAAAAPRLLRQPILTTTASTRLATAATAAAGFAAALLAAPTDCAAAKVPTHCLNECDKLFDSNQYSALADMLTKYLPSAPDDAELLWRLARAQKKQADGAAAKADKEALSKSALAHATKALELAPESGSVHKWYAISLSGIGAFQSTTDKIKNSFAVKEHFEAAVKLSPRDATSRHLLGLWCFEVAKLSWIEAKAAAALFASPPKATFEEAIGHFEAAEAMEPGFYPKNLLLLAQAYGKLGKSAEAKGWLAKCLAAEAKTPEDEETLKEAAKLKL